VEGAVYARDICTGRDGLYYYGARYLDSRFSKWLSADPALEQYLPTGDRDRDRNLPGMGGVFNPLNLAAYSYCSNNPIKYTDPDGKETKILICPPQMSRDFYHYTQSVNTGNFFGDTAMGAVANIGNLLGAVANIAWNATSSAGQTIDSSYSSVTMAVIGQDGFSGNGLSGDSFVVGMATLSMPADYQAFLVGMKGLGTWLDGLGATAAGGVTSSDLQLGQLMHKAYKAPDVLEGVRIKEFRLPSGKRIDFIDLANKTIYEYKPNNPRAIAEGTKQLQGYLQEVESLYGKGWKTVLDTY
jgi:RHS repeat-associated protein